MQKGYVLIFEAREIPIEYYKRSEKIISRVIDIQGLKEKFAYTWSI